MKVDYHVGLSPKQRKAYDFIRDRIMQTGITPTYREIRQHMGIASTSGVFRVVKALSDRGLLKMPRQGAKRSLTLATLEHAPGDVLTCPHTKQKLVYVGPVPGDMFVVYAQDDDPNYRGYVEVDARDFEFMRAA